MTGRVVALEGLYITGKTTQLKALEVISDIERLDIHICDSWEYPKWQYDDAIDFLTNPGLTTQREDLYRQELELLTELYKRNEVDKRVSDGQTVVIDQYLMSMRARFPPLGIEPERIEYDLQEFLSPDITFLFDIRPALAVSRAKVTHQTDSQKLCREYLEVIRNNYLALKDESTRLVRSGWRRDTKHEYIRSQLYPEIMFNPNTDLRVLYHKPE